MKPIDPEMGNFKDNEDNYTEKRNQWGVPSNYVFTVKAKSGRRPTLMVLFNNRKMLALIDTGSSVTIINEKMLLTSEKINILPINEELQSVTGHYLIIEGCVKAQIAIGNRIVESNVLVSGECPEELLIGMDLLQQLKGISIDLSSGNLISVPNGEVLHEVTDVFINENLSIPYRAEVFYCAEVTIDTEDDLLFQPNKSFMEKYNVSLSSGVVNVYQKNNSG